MPQVERFSGLRLVPAFSPHRALQLPIPLQAGTYGSGTAVGQITSANVVAVHTVTSTLTGGSFRLFLPWLGFLIYTGNVAYNATGSTYAANLQTALNAAIQSIIPGASVVVTGTGPFTVTYAGTLANQPLALPTIDNSLATGGTATIASTTTGVGPNGSYRAYASGNSDGSQNCEGLLEYPVVVDLAGNVWLGTQVGASEFGQSDPYTTMFISGFFSLADLVGVDATALSTIGAHMVSGSLASGVGIVFVG